MDEYIRSYPLFALCGLNCGLCPRYHTDGSSKCPGCGGKDFHLKHPSCAVITCSRKHGSVEYCFQCSGYPCDRFKKPSAADSFITYKNVLSDFARAREKGLAAYRRELDAKVSILETLIRDFDDGRRKSFYCLAVNLLPLKTLKDVMKRAARESDNGDRKEKAAAVASLLEERAREEGIELKLRK